MPHEFDPRPQARRMLIAAISVLSGVCPTAGADTEPAWPGDARLNHIQVIGTHNSYKRAIQGELFERMRAINPGADSLDYAHLPLRDQLNLGVRTLELDVCYDPDGGRYADPLGNKLLKAAGLEPDPVDDPEALAAPGFKVLHDPNFDFRTWHADLTGALRELRVWSASNPSHVPILVTMNTKQGRSSYPGAVELVPFDAEAMRELNTTVREVLGPDYLLTPDNVRAESKSLRDAVTTRGWPKLSECRGRFVFVLDEGGTTRETYLSAFPGLREAVFFTTSPPDEPTSAILIINDPVRDHDRIRSLVERGYIVRTRADAGTKEARAEDLSRFEAAKSSGAHAIKTDYPIPDRRISNDYVVRFDTGGFVRVNPVLSHNE